ncbi:MAG: pilus assembly protein FimV [Candidatus Azotimanducaceae bacterium]|jgi:pilus assembly protein FimV
MIRRLKLLIAAVVILFTPTVFALSLGELDLQSALNQQFKAEIKLTNLRGLQIDEVIPNLASQSDFDRVGVERSYLLTDLRFKVVQMDGGHLLIQVTSNKLIVEPFLNFIVEVLWPNGRILREYTVLLDPPIFGEEGVETITASETESRTSVLSESFKSGQSASQSAPQPPSDSHSNSDRQAIDASVQPVSYAASKEGKLNEDEYGVTGAGDTLWAIALKIRSDRSVSVQQTMLALLRANPEAFINNNINLLKAGHVLRLPDSREMREGSFAAAVAEVQLQHDAFDAYKSGRVAQLDGTRRSTNNDEPEQGDSSGELKLLVSNQSSGDAAGEGSSARSQELENNLAIAEEDLDRARRANTEMNARLDDLQGQLETLNEILSLKDDQLAALSAEIQERQSSPPAAAVTEMVTSPAGDSNLMTTIMSVVGGIVVLLAAIGGLIFMRRRQQAKALDDDYEEESLEDEIDEVEDEDDFDLEAENEIGIGIGIEDDVTQETNDVISEVEIYIAYGRFPQAITFLQNAIEADPNRADIQLKLLEVYVQTEDGIAFNLQLDQLRILEDDEAIQAALVLQKNIPGAAQDEAASMDATIISSEPLIAIEEPEDDDLSFDLDDLDSETEDDELNLSDELELELVELDLEDDDGFSLDLDGDDDLSLDVDDDDDEISLDLDDEDEISLDLDDEDEISLDLDDEDVFSLDLDLDDEIYLDLDDKDEISLDLEGDDDLLLDLEDEISLDSEDEISLDSEDEAFFLDLDEDEGNKLDLARAYIDMGDVDSARSVLKDVLASSVEDDVNEANKLLEKIA